MFTLSGLSDLTNYVWSKIVTAPNGTEKRGNVKVNFFYIEENVWKYERYSNDFFKNNKIDPIPHFTHEPILEWGEHKISFNKEIEIVCLCFILLKPI